MSIQLVTCRHYKIEGLKLSSISGKKKSIPIKLRPSFIMTDIVLNAVK